MKFTALVIGSIALLLALTVDKAHSQLILLSPSNPGRFSDDDGDTIDGDGERSSSSDGSYFLCPGTGKFAMKRPGGRQACKTYFVCPVANMKALSRQKCGDGKRFHRLARTCVDTAYVNCKWCTKEGRHADLTSKKHFLECVPGSVAIRYKCKEGEFDPKRKECIERDFIITDLTLDVDLDPPKDIIKFQKKWDDAEDGKSDRSIEELGEEKKKKDNVSGENKPKGQRNDD